MEYDKEISNNIEKRNLEAVEQNLKGFSHTIKTLEGNYNELDSILEKVERVEKRNKYIREKCFMKLYKPHRDVYETPAIDICKRLLDTNFS